MKNNFDTYHKSSDILNQNLGEKKKCKRFVNEQYINIETELEGFFIRI